MESLLPVLVERLVTIVDEAAGAGHACVVLEPERLARRAEDLAATADEFRHAAWSASAAGGDAPVDLGAGAFRDLGDVRDAARARGLAWSTIGPFGGEGSAEAGIAEVDDVAGTPAATLAVMRARLAQGWGVVVAAAGQGSAEPHRRAAARSEDVPARVERIWAPSESVVAVVPHVVSDGLSVGDARVVVFSEAHLTGRAGVAENRARTPSRRRGSVDPLQLRPGDFVVHERHGIGRFVELTTRTVRGIEREYIVIEYAPSRRGMPGDRLSVPTDQLDRVTKYVGGETPSLNKMGGADWAKTKGKARAAVKEIAAELIRLYSARMATKGREFGPDTPWQRELEEAFPYVETPDQLVTIDEVKADMERQVPMDRLVCGDVGFGKTEIAVRAAFKAIQDGTQVASSSRRRSW